MFEDSEDIDYSYTNIENIESSFDVFTGPNVIEKEILDEIKNNVKKIVIFGCNDGRLAQLIKQNINNDIFILGIEKNEEFSILAQNHCNKVLNLDINQTLSVLEDKYDYIIYCDLHNYMNNPVEILQKHKKYLKKNGKFLFTFHNSQFIDEISDLVNFGGAKSANTFGRSFGFPYNLDTFIPLMKETGINVESIFGAVSPLFYRWVDQYKTIHLGMLLLEIPNKKTLFKFLSFYYLIKGNIRTSNTENIEYKTTPITIHDQRSLFYRRADVYWERTGKYYLYFADKTFWEINKVFQQQIEYTVQKINELKPKSVLEVGCGYGRNLKTFRKINNKVKLTGIDVSSTQINNAHDYLKGDKVELYHYKEGELLPFKDNSFDVVFSIGVLCMCYPEVMNKLRKEMIRVSKKYVIHDEDLTIHGPRFFGYNLAEIYKKENYKIKSVESHPIIPHYQLLIIEL